MECRMRHSRWPATRYARGERESFRASLERNCRCLIEPCELEPNSTTFTVDEDEKRRRRWIVHPEEFNRRCPSTVRLPTPEEAEARLAWRFARTIDFKSYYHQFALSETDAAFVIPTERGPRRLRCVLTGAAICPLLAQTYSLAVVERMNSILRGKFGWEVVADVYLDNIRILENDLIKLNLATLQLYRAAVELQVSVNEELTETLATDPSRYVFLGVEYDHSKCTTQLGPKTRRKLEKLKASLDDIEEWSCATALHAFGVLQYASLVSGTSKAEAYYAFKFMRRRAAERTALRAPARVWPSCVPAWRWWVCQVSGAPPKQFRTGHVENVILYTDASLHGAGTVIMVGGRSWTFGRRWSAGERTRHINVLEAKALLFGLTKLNFGLTRLNYLAPGSEAGIGIRVDNTSVIGALGKKRSGSFLLNYIIGKICTHPLYPRITSIEYVMSAENKADRPSRLGFRQNDFVD